MITKVVLPTGELKLTVHNSVYPLEDLCGFAARNNAKRGFLFVSKVLGKHWPVRPSVMQQTHQVLASQISKLKVSGPVLMIGMAETATALGQGIFKQFCNHNNFESLYVQTTRYHLNCSTLSFNEEHSHATKQLLHLPSDFEKYKIFTNAQTVVLIDDELSTGTTFINLAKSLCKYNKNIKHIIIATITNWLNPEYRELLINSLPCLTTFVELLTGTFIFTPNKDFKFGSPAKSMGDGVSKNISQANYNSRLGLLPNEKYLEYNTKELLYSKNDKILILGSGEFMFEPYQFALDLENKNYDVWFQATTRSPILVSNDITYSSKFIDNYGEGIDNFLYNVPPNLYDQVIIGYETYPLPKDHSLPSYLNLQNIFMV